jgi:F-type H+-transporting ATPase subunit epsilon
MAENLFKLRIISPDREFYNGDVEMVEMVTTEGEIGILKGHIPTTAVAAPGILKIHEAEGIKDAVLIDGIIRIMQEDVTILAEDCNWPEEIDINRAREAKIRAERRLRGEEEGANLDRAEIALRRAIARINAVEGR